MKPFNPGVFPPLPDKVSILPQHGEAWSQKHAHWWAGTTIASPTYAIAAPAIQCVTAIRRYMGEGVEQLNSYYREETEFARHWVRRLLELPESEPVLLDASGTAAILLATRILAHVAYAAGARSFFTITTDEGGSLVPAALRGRDPNEMEKVMFQPNTGLFYEPVPVLPYPPLTALPSQMVHIGRLDNDQIVAELRRKAMEQLAAGHRFGVLMLPHVVKSGRILPARQIANMVAELKELGLNLYYVLDDVQGFCRTDAETISNPLAFCDAYVLGASKALGGLLIASAVAMREELLERFIRLAERQELTAMIASIAHFQFPPNLEDRLPDEIMKRSAVSLPEVVAMSWAMYYHYFRGEGETYSQRRRSQLLLVERQRRHIVAALKTVDGVEVLENTAERPIVPSIVSFKVGNFSPAALKEALQDGKPAITTGAPIGRYMRLDIPEYRAVPPIDLLVERLKLLLSDKHR
jgi:hypothetical protein